MLQTLQCINLYTLYVEIYFDTVQSKYYNYIEDNSWHSFHHIVFIVINNRCYFTNLLLYA